MPLNLYACIYGVGGLHVRRERDAASCYWERRCTSTRQYMFPTPTISVSPSVHRFSMHGYKYGLSGRQLNTDSSRVPDLSRDQMISMVPMNRKIRYSWIPPIDGEAGRSTSVMHDVGAAHTIQLKIYRCRTCHVSRHFDGPLGVRRERGVQWAWRWSPFTVTTHVRGLSTLSRVSPTS